MPKQGTIETQGLTENIDFEELFSVPREFWLDECERIKSYFGDQVGDDLPQEIWNQLNSLKERLLAESSVK